MSEAPASHPPERTVRRAARAETAAVAHLLARAFSADPIERWCLACDDLPALMDVEFLEVTQQLGAEGWLWVTDDLHAVAAWLPPGARYADSIDAIVIPELSAHGGQPERMVRFWDWVDDHRPTATHWYLDLLAVDPVCRGRGMGRLLLEHGLGRLDTHGAAAFLVTANSRTVPWYQDHGFVICSEGPPPGGGPYVWFMLRHPRSDAGEGSAAI